MGANRKFKSSVFITLFNDPERLMSLYNAVTGSTLPLETPIEMATLDDVSARCAKTRKRRGI